MPLLSGRSKRYLESYGTSLRQLQQAAEQAQAFIEEVLADYGHAIHAVKARAKNLDSVREKLRRKNYLNPDVELTDVIGVRVITYFAADVDAVAAALERRLDVSVRKSRDARQELEVDRFGYRSLHLIARLRLSEARKGSRGDLRRRWFEIQIRSILDHAWAEIEHETVYKAAIEFPSEVRRRYRAVAGALEVIENAFSGLTTERDVLVERYKKAYAVGQEFEKTFDAARLVAFMEVQYPNAPSLRVRVLQQTVLEPTNNSSLISALKTTKLHNPRRLKRVFSSARCRRLVEQFAAESGYAPHEVSHRARVILAVVVVRPEMIRAQFPELLGDPALTRIARVDL